MNVTLRRVYATNVELEKQRVLHILMVCFVALDMRHAMHRIVICGL